MNNTANSILPVKQYPWETTCRHPLPDEGGFSAVEKWVWEQRLCLGLVADLSEFESQQERILSNNFLRTILLHEPFRSAMPCASVFISHAIFTDPVNLNDEHILHDLKLSYCVFEQQISICFSRFNRTLDLSYSHFKCGLDARNLQVAANLYLHDATVVGNTNLMDSRVGTVLSANTAIFQGEFNANRLHIDGALFLSNGAVFERAVILRNAKLGSVLSLVGSVFKGEFNGNGLQVGSYFFLNGGATFWQQVNLLNARVGNNLETKGSIFKDEFNADSLQVDSYLFLREGTIFYKQVSLLGAKISGDVQLWGSTFFDKVLMINTRIDQTLYLGDEKRPPPSWQSHAELILRNSEVGALQDTDEAWYMDDSKEYIPTDLSGFVYHRTGSLYSYATDDRPDTLGHRSINWLLGWLKSQKSHDISYSPQPYEELAQTLEGQGITDKARQLRIRMFDYKRRVSQSSLDEKIFSWLSKYSIGYGYKSWWSLLWIMVLSFCGALLGYWELGSPNENFHFVDWFFFSLDQSVPLLMFSQDYSNVNIGISWVRYWFYVQNTLNFMLVSLFFAGACGIMR